MDSERFDSLARLLAAGISRRGALAGLAALAGVSLIARDEAVAKKKKRKKKRKKKTAGPPSPPPPPRQSPPPPPRPVVQCVGPRRACPAGNCCPGLTCGRNNECGGGDSCLRDADGSCESDCDCVGLLSCSERAGNTCQACSGFREGCPSGNDDCCLSASICGNNGCVNDNDGDVCCLPNVGTACASSCQCCADLGCDERSGFTCQSCVREASALFSLADQDACTVDGECCRAEYVCGDRAGCQGQPPQVCCGPPQQVCDSDCDCCGVNSNCPRAIAGETNACGISGVCCQFAGGACGDACDCCAGLDCIGNVCGIL